MHAFASVLLPSLLSAGTILTALALDARRAVAQQDRATLIAFVTASATGEPLGGAQLVVEGTGIWGITDQRGMLRLAGIPAGSRTLEVRRLGFARERVTVQLRTDRVTELSFALAIQPIALAELRVRAHRRRPLLELSGFERRKARGFGTFITWQQIENRRPNQLSDVLRGVPGVQLAATNFSDARASMMRAAAPSRRCPIQYYVDGVQVYAFNIDDVRPHDVEGIEIYKGAAEIPPDFNRGTAMCGVIVIWTRDPYRR